MDKLSDFADKIVDTDILIIGGEGAGGRAAIEAAKYNVKTTIVTKGIQGKCGATLTAGTDIDVDSKSIKEVLGMEGDVRDSKDLFAEDMLIEGGWANNQKIVEKHVEDAPIRIKELVDWGMELWGPTLAPGHRYPRGVYSRGRYVVRVICEQIKKHADKIQVIENTMVTDLLTHNGKVVGATGVNIWTGEFCVFRAKAVIIATGGGQRIYPYTTAPEELTGDGHMMAYRAGAELEDMQYVQFLTSTFRHPPTSTSSINPLLVTGIWLLNNRGERFMRTWDPERMETATRDIVAVGIMNEIVEGRGWTSQHGDYVYASMKHLPDNMIEDYALKMPRTKEFWDNMKKNAVPTFSASHFFCGGIKVNEDTETILPGLYAAGECSAGDMGGNRLSGNAVTMIVVQGAIAGKKAAEYALKAKEPEVDIKQVKELRDKVFQPLERKDGASAMKIKRRIQKMAWENIGVVRQGTWLEEALKEIEEMKKELPMICVRNKSRIFNKEWVDALQAQNMLELVEIIARSALMRTESRGVHFRKDYPNTDNNKWLKNIIAKQVNGKAQLRTEPTVITKWQPPKGCQPYPWR